MEAHERQLVVDQFNASERRLLELLEGLTPGQWTFHEKPERWSIAEIVEHLIAVEARITRAIAKTLAAPPDAAKGDPSKRPAPAVEDAFLLSRITDRTTKLSAPEPVRPVGKWPGTSELMAEFRKTREHTLAFVAETQADLRSHCIPHMAFGDLDLYQWLIVLSRHGARHALQIEEIKANPAFPADSAVTV
jgi:hypothetical protein